MANFLMATTTTTTATTLALLIFLLTLTLLFQAQVNFDALQHSETLQLPNGIRMTRSRPDVESDDSPSGLKFKVYCFLKLTDRSGWVGLGQVISGQVRSGQVRFSLVWFG